MKQRLAFIDYGKALAIILVLMIHLGLNMFQNYMVFTVALFFITYGYTFNLDGRTFNTFATKHFIKLILAFWGLMLLDIPLEIVRAHVYNYGTYKIAIPALVNTVYGSGGKFFNILGLRNYLPYVQISDKFVDLILPTNCHLWFLPAMFVASILFFVIMKRYKDNIFSLILISLMLLFIAGVESLDSVPQLPYGIGRGCIGAAFMIFGYKFREISYFESSSLATKIVVISVTLAISFAFIKFLGINGLGYV